jgi:hypothetical protein
MKIIKLLTFAALAAVVLLQTSIARGGEHGPLQITFQKCSADYGAHYSGTVGGDCGDGTVFFTSLSLPWGAKVLHISGEYAITTPDCSFKAVCVGIADVRSGHIVLNGVVTEGEHLGAQVQVRAQGNADLSCSEGTITVTPSGD